MTAVSLDWVLNQLAGMRFPKHGGAHAFIEQCVKTALPKSKRSERPRRPLRGRRVIETPSMDYLLGEVVVDGPEMREEAIGVNLERGQVLDWPEGWWAVSDDKFAYIGFFQFEEDAWAYRMYIINQRQNGAACTRRYDDGKEGLRLISGPKEWVVGWKTGTGTQWYMRTDGTAAMTLNEAHGFPTKKKADLAERDWGKMHTTVKRRKDWLA